MNKPLDLDDGYAHSSEADWLSLLTKGRTTNGLTTKGRDADAAGLIDKLTYQTLDPIAIAPVYPRSTQEHAEPGDFPYRRATSLTDSTSGWDIRQIYRENDPKQLNKVIVHELERGVTSVHLVANSPPAAEDLELILKGVYPELITLSLEAGDASLEYAERLCNTLKLRGVPDEEVRLAINADPIADRCGQALHSSDRRNNFAATIKSAIEKTSDLVSQFSARYPHSTSIGVNTSVWHNGGASDAQEIAVALATGLTYLKALIENGVSAENAAQQIQFRFSIDADFFAGISKLRAARQCWAHLCQHCGISDSAAQMRIHAVTSTRMLSAIDPAVNQLRNTVACAAAALGGANAISVEPHKTVSKTLPATDPDQQTRRIARNIQLVLQEESQLHKVTDPMGGSGAIETRTDDLVSVAWLAFQQLESEGGLPTSIEQDAFTARVRTMHEKRDQLIKTRRLPLVGVSVYASQPASVDQGSAEQHASDDKNGSNPVLPGADYRSSVPFEHLQANALRWRCNNPGKEASVFVATLGKPVDYQGRLAFTKNLLAAAALGSLEAPGLERDTTDTVSAFERSDCKVAIICSSDTLYKQHAEALCRDLKKVGAQFVAIASHPDTVGSFATDQTFDDCLFLHCDAVKKLATLQQAIGMQTSAGAAP